MRHRAAVLGRATVWVLLAAAILYGLITLVNSVAYLAGVGEPVTVHVERSERQVGWTGDTYAEGDVSTGYYELRGDRHEVTLFGIKGKQEVETRRPLLAEGAVLFLHVWWQAAAGVFVGVLCAGIFGWLGWMLYADEH